MTTHAEIKIDQGSVWRTSSWFDRCRVQISSGTLKSFPIFSNRFGSFQINLDLFKWLVYVRRRSSVVLMASKDPCWNWYGHTFCLFRNETAASHFLLDIYPNHGGLPIHSTWNRSCPLKIFACALYYFIWSSFSEIQTHSQNDGHYFHMICS